MTTVFVEQPLALPGLLIMMNVRGYIMDVQGAQKELRSSKGISMGFFFNPLARKQIFRIGQKSPCYTVSESMGGILSLTLR